VRHLPTEPLAVSALPPVTTLAVRIGSRCQSRRAVGRLSHGMNAGPAHGGPAVRPAHIGHRAAGAAGSASAWRR
jgi:hypothetical protein